ncbi:hypothetical protein M218_19535 [Burkholderia pseudomallei MSHR338]|nr:hypothetical protein M218_19535 [Burkholderia pseudomallei MSHR338]
MQGRRRWPFRRAGIDTFEIGTSGIPVDAPPIVPIGGAGATFRLDIVNLRG